MLTIDSTESPKLYAPPYGLDGMKDSKLSSMKLSLFKAMEEAATQCTPGMAMDHD